MLSFNFIVHSIDQFLEKNHTANINENEKVIFYSIVTKYKSPLFMLINALHKFGHRNKKILSIDYEFCLMNKLKILLESKFENYKKEKNNETIEGSCKIDAELII